MAYAPATNTTNTASLPHYQAIYYNKRALDNITKTFIFSEPAMKDSLPKRSGKTVQWYRSILSAIVPATITAHDGFEGSVGTGITMTSAIVSATVSQYTDFMSISDFAEEVGIDDSVESATDNMSYRGAYIFDTVTRAEVDSPHTTRITSTAGAGLTLLGANYRASDARNARHQMEGLDIKPMDSGPARGEFFGVIHPYVSYDLVNDPSAAGLMDLKKYTDPGMFLKNNDDRSKPIASAGGVMFFENTNVKTISDGGTNYWRVYVFGKNAYGIVNLAGEGPTPVKDPQKSRFNVRVIRSNGGGWDPAGVIAAWVSFNVKFSAKILDSPNLNGAYRYRMSDAPSSIVA
jgi:N4-gp56 family major capsid protein